MVAEKQTKSAKYLRIVSMLRHLLSNGKITEKEYGRAKRYYKQLTGENSVRCGSIITRRFATCLTPSRFVISRIFITL